jgi:hypothetical protein
MEEETTEEKIASSTGNDTERFSKDLEAEADALIMAAYGEGDNKEEAKKDDKGDKKDDKEAEGSTDGDGDKVGTGESDGDTEGDAEEKVKVIDPEISSLLGKLEKSEKRVKDTRADHTRGRQDLKEAQSRSQELEDTVFALKKQVEDLTTASTQKQEAKAEKVVAKTSGDIEDQIAAMQKIDPDLAATMKPIVESMFGQINTLKTDLATEKQEAKDRTAQDENDAHFAKLDGAHKGWEETMQTPEFAEYLQDLPPRSKRLALLDLKGGTAENIIELFDEFKDSGNEEDEADAKKNDKLAKAKSLSNPASKKSKNINTGALKMLYTRSQIDNMTEAEYAKEEDAIDKAMANGQIESR